jgi:hypothetical protein
MNRKIPELNKIDDVVLAYRPSDKKKKLATKAKKVEGEKKNAKD